MGRLATLPDQRRRTGCRWSIVRGHRSVRRSEVAGGIGGSTQDQDVPAAAGASRVHPEIRRQAAAAGIKDRVVQTALWIVPEPIFEADLQPEQYAYREHRSALDAVQAVHHLLGTGYTEVADANLSGYFDSIPHAELMQCVARRVSDKAVLHLVKLWLVAAVEAKDARGHVHRTTRNKNEGRGSPQGSPISPLLANLYRRRFVLGWKTRGTSSGSRLASSTTRMTS